MSSTIIDQIREIQAMRVWYLKTRIMNSNRLVAKIALELGYRVGMPEKERKKAFKKAVEIINEVYNNDAPHPFSGIIKQVNAFVEQIDAVIKAFEKKMVALAIQLPAAEWVARKDQQGFGLLGLAIVVGECGDLNNYSNPGKLWKRMGCAPVESDGKTHMPSTWNGGKHGRLSSEEWSAAGYSPRRRSVAFNMGDSLLKQNLTTDKDTKKRTWTGPYRARYDEVKEGCREKHPEWFVCSVCGGTKKKAGKTCTNCKGTGEVAMHAHRHAMLLATKLLLKNLWIAWTNGGQNCVSPRMEEMVVA